MHRESIATSFGTFHVAVDGPESGEKVLLVHGLAASLHLWDDTLPVLAGRGIRGVAIDVLGHGRSEKPLHLFTIEQHAEAAAELISVLGWEQCVIAGNSMGALIALAAAARFPDRVTGVIAVGCPAWGSTAERMNWLRMRSVLVDLATGLPMPATPVANSSAGRQVHEDRELIGLWLLNSIWATGTYDLMADLQAVRVPVHVVYGENDWLLSSGRNLEALRSVTFATVANAGHHTPLDQGAAMAEQIRSFVEGRAPLAARV